MSYTIKDSPLTGTELVVDTDHPEAVKLLRSLGARYALRHGWFLRPSRVRLFEALMEAEAVALKNRRFRFPDGIVRDVYQAADHIRQTTGLRTMV